MSLRRLVAGPFVFAFAVAAAEMVGDYLYARHSIDCKVFNGK